jgi:hypothetical protein
MIVVLDLFAAETALKGSRTNDLYAGSVARAEL